MAKDYYSILGVPRNASQADIQKAYRELARKHHPDMNPNDKTAKKRFQEIQTAFDVLNNTEKREMYDRYGSSFETQGAGDPRGAYTGSWSPGAGGAGPGGGPAGFNPEDIDLSQFLGERFGREMPGGAGDIFGQFRRAAGKFRKPSAAPQRGGDLHQELEIPFTTAITGGEVQITVQRPKGKAETLAVKIPPGIEDGKKIRVRGHGQPAPRGGKPGDILLTIRVLPHPSFHRRGNQLHVRVPVTLGEAVAGAKIDLPTPRGVVALRIPPGTSSGTKLRVKGYGVKPKNGTPGDLLAEILIVLPKQLGDADRQAIQQIDERYPRNPRADLRW
ncbi:MAG: J domain-containing protein [Planctomycetes bacterium]|nr:J domain-containing protein [Planctomycetota bacterium]MCG2684909.1 J domain-containing protein [Planctomycetales bacterium]